MSNAERERVSGAGDETEADNAVLGDRSTSASDDTTSEATVGDAVPGADRRGEMRGLFEGSSTELAGGAPAPEAVDSGYASGAVSPAFSGSTAADPGRADRADDGSNMDMDIPNNARQVTPGNM